jgi:mono/diheme cytochrome c family protein
MRQRFHASGQNLPRLCLIALAVLALCAARPAGAADPPAPDKAFVGDHCTGCHNAEDRKGRLDLTTLAFDPKDPANLAVWIKVHDRVAAGEMPPKSRPRPDAAGQKVFVEGLAKSIVATERAALAGEGRATLRRLNRHEYENALRDLLGVPWAQVADRLPEDGEVYRFNKSGEALDVSYLTMARFIDSANHALRLATATGLERPAKTTRKLYARDEPSLRNWWPRENGTLPDRLSFPVLDSRAQPDVRAGRAPATNPATREREAVGKVSSIFSDAGGYSWNGWRAPVAARYKLRVAGYTVWVAGGGVARWFYEGQGAEKAPVYHTLLWHRPNLDEVYPGKRNEPIGVYASGGGQTRPVGAIDFTPKPTVGEIEVFLLPGEVIRTDGSRLFRTRVNGTDEQYVNPLATEDGMPGYAVQWVEIEGPFYDDPVGGAGYRLLFDNLKLVPSKDARTGVPLEIGPAPVAGPGGGRPPGGPGGFGRGAIREAPYEVESAEPRKDAERLLRSFLTRAYRRPVAEADVKRFLTLYDDQFKKGHGFTRSLLSAYSAVLASPAFVFVEAKPGRLDDHALATRLALFLWNSIPDDTLRALADRGELSKPDVLRRQTERMLNDPKSRRFVEAFTDYWLDLRKIDDTSPSATLYNDYELDDPLKLAAVEETRLFFAELLRADLPARNVVDSDFTFLNERLADQYGIRGVSGVAFRKVKLPADSVRGGLMTQASVLKVTANGTTTSPVLRGHWITERILGLETPPPPPTVEAVEPDIRGAVTIRQQLEKHRTNAGCASCHGKMDPPGFALESFDVMGGYRERYRAVSDKVKPVKGYGMNGQAFAFHYALPVDSPGELPDGRAFKDVRELKKLLAQDEVAIARNLVRQLTVFATGAPVRFSDRDEVEKILAAAKTNQYGVRSIVRTIVQSELFRDK